MRGHRDGPGVSALRDDSTVSMWDGASPEGRGGYDASREEAVRRELRRTAWIVLWLLLLGRWERADAARSPGYERYGANEGLASGEVLSVAEDREGYLWAATFASGVQRFDGQAFERFGPEQGLTSLRVKRIYIDREGQVWVATLSGLFRFEQGRFVRDARLGNAAIFDLLQTRDGAWWFATMDGALCLSDGERLQLTEAQGLPTSNATALAEGPAGEVWIGTTRGLARFHRGRLTAFCAPRSDLRRACDRWPGLSNDYVTRLLADRDGMLWLATDWGVAHFDGERFQTLDLGLIDRRIYVLDLLRDQQGWLRIATLGAGVLSWDGVKLRQLSVAQGLPSANVWSLALRESGGLWIGTEEHGLFLREDGAFSPVVSSERLAGAVPADLVRSRDGSLWVGTIGAGVFRLEDGPTALLGRAPSTPLLLYGDGLPSDFVRRLHLGRSGLWIGTKVGAALWTGSKLDVLDARREPFPVRDLAEDAGGALWLVNKEEGLLRYQPLPSPPSREGEARYQRQRFPLATQPTPAALWSMAQDRQGRLWLGATSALYRFDGKTFVQLPAAGISSTDRLVQLAFEPSAQDRLWFRSDEAVGFVETSVTPARWASLPLPRTAWLAVTPQGEVLAAAEDGLYHLATHPSGTVRVLNVVSPAEGYPRSAADASGVVIEPDGTLLFGTGEGIFRFDRRKLRGPSRARIHLRGLRLFEPLAQVTLPLPDTQRPLSLAHDQNSLALDFDATAFPAPELLEFRYRLDGLSGGWSPPMAARRLLFPQLPPGRFVVRLQARHGGDWDSELTVGVIEIRPAYFQMWWFRIGAGMLGLLLALSLPILRASSLRRQRDRLELLVAERTRELERYSGQLQELVAARTRELEQTYATLLSREAERNRAAEALATANRQATLGRLAGVVAHQVNTPLAVIKARLSLLREDHGDLGDVDSSLSVLERQVDRIARTVRMLLGFVRQREVAGDNPDVAAVVGSVVELYADVLKSKRVALTVTVPRQPLRVRSTVDDLQELLLNLVENAREAVSEGGEIRIAVATQDGWLRLSVEDNGTGLGDDPDRVFQPFYTTKSTGTGLGLAIARSIADAYGGSLRGENRSEGPGACFVLSLPLFTSAVDV